VLLTLVAVPATAFAASYQYALNRYVDDFTTVSSAVGTVAGGKAALAGTSPLGTRVVIQTYAAGAGILYASSGAGSVSFTHGARSGVQSRCYWYYSGGPISGTTPINCWRYA
jgi:hypothetical protein